MITYSSLMIVGAILFIIGLFFVVRNFIRFGRDISGGYDVSFDEMRKRMNYHLFAGLVTSIGGLLTSAGFIWFLVTLI